MDFAEQLQRLNLERFNTTATPPTCLKHGSPATELSTGMLICEACSDESRRAREEQERAQAFDLAFESWRTSVADLPRWPWADFGSADYRKSVHTRVLKAWTDWDGTSSMALLAPSGFGKTSGFIAWCRQRGRRLRDERDPDLVPRFVYATHIALTRSHREHPLGRGTAPLVKRALTAKVLVLDEVAAAGTDVGLLHQILDDRYQAGRPHVALSGWGSVQLKSMLGDATTRRLLGRRPVLDLFTKGSR